MKQPNNLTNAKQIPKRTQHQSHEHYTREDRECLNKSPFPPLHTSQLKRKGRVTTTLGLMSIQIQIHLLDVQCSVGKHRAVGDGELDIGGGEEEGVEDCGETDTGLGEETLEDEVSADRAVVSWGVEFDQGETVFG